MRRLTQQLSWLVGMSVTGTFLLCCVFAFRIGPTGVPGLGSWRMGAWSTTVACVAIASVSFALLIWAHLQIRKGIRTDRWTGGEIERWRNLIEHPVVQIVSWTLLGVALILVIFVSSGNHLSSDGYWNCFILFQSTSGLRETFKRAAPSRAGPSIYPVKALHSEHWGE